MKLYCDPLSTTSRPVMMFIAEHGLDVEIVHVDLMSGGNQAPDYLALNPNGIVPFLVDGDLKLGESVAILKYLARKTGSSTYPTDLVGQAKVDEALSWLSTQFHEYFCLFVCYPHMGVPHGAPPELMQAMLAFGAETAPRWLKVLDGHMLAGRPYICGDEITIADHLGLAFVPAEGASGLRADLRDVLHGHGRLQGPAEGGLDGRACDERTVPRVHMNAS
jgi:glutathione S-transferase